MGQQTLLAMKLQVPLRSGDKEKPLDLLTPDRRSDTEKLGDHGRSLFLEVHVSSPESKTVLDVHTPAHTGTQALAHHGQSLTAPGSPQTGAPRAPSPGLPDGPWTS